MRSQTRPFSVQTEHLLMASGLFQQSSNEPQKYLSSKVYDYLVLLFPSCSSLKTFVQNILFKVIFCNPQHFISSKISHPTLKFDYKLVYAFVTIILDCLMITSYCYSISIHMYVCIYVYKCI